MQKISSNVYRSGGLWGTGVLSANVYFLTDRKVSIIDTGYKGRASQICRDIKKLGYSLSDVENIILTHHHIDHTDNLYQLKKLTGANIIAHVDESPYIEGRLPHFCPEVPAKRQLIRYFLRTCPVPVDIKVKDSEVPPVLGGLRVIDSPGHTPGSISLKVLREDVIIVGDLMANTFRLGLPSRAFTVNMPMEIASICKIADMDFDIICFGHGMPIKKDARHKVNSLARKLRKY